MRLETSTAPSSPPVGSAGESGAGQVSSNAVIARDVVEARPSRRRVLDPSQRKGVLGELERFLNQHVKDQPHLISSVLQVATLAVTVKVEKGTAGNAMLLGPTGTGKTLTVEKLAEFCGAQLIVVNGGEYQEHHSVSNLIGASISYHESGLTPPKLTNASLKAAKGSKVPFTIVLIDEAEKLHRTIKQWLLGALAGAAIVRVPDPTKTRGDRDVGSKEETLDLSTTIFVLTTNAAAEASQVVFGAPSPKDTDSIASGTEAPTTASATEGKAARKLPENVRSGLLEHFAPEFLGRVHTFGVAKRLSDASLKSVLELEVKRVRRELEAGKSIDTLPLRLTPAAKYYLLSKVDRFFGARNVKMVLNTELQEPLSTLIGNGDLQKGDQVVVDVDLATRELRFNATPSAGLIGAEPPGPATAKGRSWSTGQEPSPASRHICASHDPEVVLTLTRDLVGHAEVLRLGTLDVLLRSMPRGTGWGELSKGHNNPAIQIVNAATHSTYSTEAIGGETGDVALLLNMLSRTTASVEKDLREEWRALAHEIVDSSRNKKRLFPAFMQQLHRTVDRLVDALGKPQ